MNAPGARATHVIPSLDGFRAFAFLAVFLAHAGAPGIPGGFGVTVFFFLSGYLITTLLRLEVEHSGRINFKLFYLRRVLRILPPFYLVLALAIGLTLLHVLPGTLALRPVLSQAFHYSNYWAAYHGFDGTAAGTAVYWSLAVEEHFYALFPALFALLIGLRMSGKSQRAVLLSLCALALLWRCVLVFHFHARIERTFLTTDARYDSLLFGCAMAVAGNPSLDGVAEARPSKGLVALLLGGVALLLLSFLVRDDSFRESFRYTVQGIGLYPIFYTAIRFPGWGPFPLLSARPLRFLGKLSYSLYLVHESIIVWTIERWPTGGIVRVVAAFALSLALAWLMWVTIEKPIARVRRRLDPNTI